MRVLVACEFSGVVREAFARRGHDAWSCDLLASKIPGQHIQGNVLDILAGWDLMIAHPPCTYLCNSGVLRLYKGGKKRNGKDFGRWQDMNMAAGFFASLLAAPIPRICVENPVMHGHALALIRQRHTQTVQPWEFGEDASKRTCLWLKGLPLLKATNTIRKERYANQTPSGQNKLGPSPERAATRAITYQGIADAMAEQWS